MTVGAKGGVCGTINWTLVNLSLLNFKSTASQKNNFYSGKLIFKKQNQFILTENNFKVQQTILKFDKQFLIEKANKLKRQNRVKDNTLVERSKLAPLEGTKLNWYPTN